ncbi:uncharacterized protein LOC112052581 [Bicyclus anynana]|uniref:Uncharacterized protein LOC112052581 n=1 Tax=Bicyclus anynana TaxID=110368 RepID=A0A6J1NVT8_BICAN|nr:uncharacterized protein LOC112052581 [Bicyclus anynana]XP_052742057.1 uncharacterized protein LOC112052581 [Bicyclus anynana]
MDQMQVPASLPHIVQVYPPSVSIHPSLQSQGKVSYQQSITSESLHIPVSSHIHDIQNQHLISQNQTVMSCQQIHLQNVQPLQTQMQSQVLQGDMSQQLQITSHVILPQVPMFKQHLLTNTLQHQFYGEYEAFLKDNQCVVAKVEANMPIVNEKEIEIKPDSQTKVESVDVAMKKRARNQIPNPNKWACNVRKQKHQRGEAYISRRGKLVPERHIRNTKDCLKSCRYKCSERINDVDRQHIFKAFYSLNANEKKHFLLNTTERNSIKNKLINSDNKRKYSFKYFFLVRAVRYTVCKNFYLGTLSISQKPVYNVHIGKSDMNLPKPDGRGLSEASAHSLSADVKDRVRKHIMSFNTTDSKPIKQFSRKKQYLESNLSIKQMYDMYVTECSKDDVTIVKESMYRKIFKQEFNLHFKKNKNGQFCCRCKGSIKKK